ncbi:MAG: YybH family protein [Myxococcaceae bacterium]
MLAFFAAALISLSPPPSPELAVKALLTTQADAWNKGDLEAFCSVYADDAAFITPKGVSRGKAEVLARYKSRYPTKAAMGTLSFTFLDVRADASHASVGAQWKLSYPDKPEASGYTLVVLHKTEQGWRLVQDASM